MSLVEVLVVISLSIVLVSITFPKINTNSYYLNNITVELLNDLRYTKKLNMLGNKSSYVEILSENKGYKLVESSETKKEIIFPKNMTISCNQYSKFTFNTNGTIQGPGTTIKLNYLNSQKEITILPSSGRIYIK